MTLIHYTKESKEKGPGYNTVTILPNCNYLIYLILLYNINMENKLETPDMKYKIIRKKWITSF